MDNEDFHFSLILKFLTWFLTPKPNQIKPMAIPSIPSLPTDPVTAGLDVVAEGAAVAGEIVAAENTPEMQKARHNVELQKDKDRARQDAEDALKTGDVTKVNEDLA